MASSPTSAGHVDRAARWGRGARSGRPDLGPLRWPYLAFDREEVAGAEEQAVCASRGGVLWEYDGRRFLITHIVAGVWRRPATPGDVVPPGPWRHLPACACEVCRLGNV